MATHGIIIAGLSSSSGKTLITLGLLRALSNAKIPVSAGKTGPDYIDPGFHHAACNAPSVNLDGFAMTADMLRHLARQQPADLLLIEGVMGLFDGGEGSAASLAKHLGLPLMLVLDCRGQAETTAEIAAALQHRLKARSVTLAGVILNRISTPRHGAIIRQACVDLGINVLGEVPNTESILMPSRHLGLVQAMDLAALGALDELLDQAGAIMRDSLDLAAIQNAASPITPPDNTAENPTPASEALPPPGQTIAVAYDAAFGFAYHHLLEGWRRQGARVSLFSPLADEAPALDADFIFLPGGYPELHLPALTAATAFKDAMRDAARRGIPIYGECGGYMVLGHGIINADGQHIPMLGLLELETSFVKAKRVLGYRRLDQIGRGLPFWPDRLNGHEFHFTAATKAEGEALFRARDKSGQDLGAIGLVRDRVAGSYAHIIAADG